MKKNNHILFIILVCIFLIGCVHQQETSLPSEDNPAIAIINFYQGPLNHLSAVRHGTCPMHPSCSDYSKESFQKYGLVVGWIMSTDRLLRCGRDEIRFAPKVFVDGRWKYYDPVENNVPSTQQASSEKIHANIE